MEGFNMQQTQQGIISVSSPQNYRVVSMQENWNGGKTAFMLKWQCSAIIVSRVQLSHKLYNNGDGLIKLPYNVLFSRLSNYCSVLSHS